MTTQTSDELLIWLASGMNCMLARMLGEIDAVEKANATGKGHYLRQQVDLFNESLNNAIEEHVAMYGSHPIMKIKPREDKPLEE
jgi:hypothetical protein